jgi:hypothetical protein
MPVGPAVCWTRTRRNCCSVETVPWVRPGATVDSFLIPYSLFLGTVDGLLEQAAVRLASIQGVAGAVG